MFDLVSGGLSTQAFAAALAVTLFAGFVKGAVGFAMPMILVSAFAIFLPQHLALAGLILPTFATNLSQAFRQGVGPAVETARSYRRFLTEQLRRLSQVFGRPEEEDFAQLSDMLFGAIVATPLIHALVGDEATHGPAETALRCRRLVAALLPERGQGDAKVGDDSFGL